jgi:hypothetical protein
VCVITVVSSPTGWALDPAQGLHDWPRLGAGLWLLIVGVAVNALPCFLDTTAVLVTPVVLAPGS